MPLFLFHIYNDEVAIDRKGRELADFETARQEAIQAARELVCDAVRRGEVVMSHRIEVEDEDGRPLFVIRYADAFTLRE